MRKVPKNVYGPVGFAVGAAGGLVAGAVFDQLWKRLGHQDDAPSATDEDRGWGEILLAMSLRGAVFAAVKAAVDRGGAIAVRRATGSWPA
ncbi:DUF4235 domain-containing protein [uncultured Streptomyces sp.]|uniref:DUF4235 domain-containing protein n=1 Tax=uncultured Streptomyces sp. TaxID=174707 RepID=UPI00262EDCD6|nr:DUF4235 domain-containing protein [uncultured Streptomyces sp.]